MIGAGSHNPTIFVANPARLMPPKTREEAQPSRRPSRRGVPSPEAPPGRSAVREVVRALRRQIQSGQLKPGEWLREVRLAEELKSSRSSVREALRVLAGDGLVEIERFRGARVTTPSLYEIFDLFEVRAALFGLAARFACFRAPDAALREIVMRIERLVADAESTTAEQRVNEGVEIGTLIGLHASADARAMLATAHRKARWHLSYLDLGEAGGSYGPLADWSDLAAKLAARNAEGAADAARRIVYYMQQEVTKVLVARGAGGL
ncbi:GntR family transcriptional regulator [Phenylobacterium sp. VNQ135]|uniref:GntR family transcriptional regulator n=1 Tax=Phenylobacterium sp. VNQ135 TaxID=3400922 RepID=UPI003BFF945E